VVGCGGAGGFGGGGGGNVMAAAVVATTAEVRRWWATTYSPWARVVGFRFFIVFQKSLPRAISALGTRAPSGIHLALGIGLFVGPAVPSGLCREYSSLCREELAVGTAPDSGSGGPPDGSYKRMQLLSDTSSLYVAKFTLIQCIHTICSIDR
jgi:hypothetical protein